MCRALVCQAIVGELSWDDTLEVAVRRVLTNSRGIRVAVVRAQHHRAWMSGLYVVQLFLEAAVLGLLVRWIAPHNATADLFNMVVVIGGALLGGLLINWWLAEKIGSWTLVLQAALLVGLLIMVSGTNPVQAGMVTVSFFAVKVAVLLVLGTLLRSA